MTVINRRISTPADVSVLAREPEGETLDYKESGDPKKWWEMAKDIAAFANHLGGVLLVGADEDTDGFPMFLGLPPQMVTPLITAYDDAALKRCRPSPMVVCTRIQWHDGREMLAVNVQAYAAGIVGAEFYKLNKNNEPVSSNAWQFPIRVGKDNVSLPLEQAIMHMSTHARRIAILLAAIPNECAINITFQYPDSKELRIPAPATLEAFSVQMNAARFAVPDLPPPIPAIPLDDIEAVWQDTDGSWSVRVSGFLDEWIDIQGSHTTSYHSRPRRTP